MIFHKKIFSCIILSIIFFGFFVIVRAGTGWTLEQPLPGLSGPIKDPAYYFYKLYIFGLGAAGILAVAVITYAGFLWMTSPAIGTIENAKKMIWGAIGGVILLLASYLILYTINPELIKLKAPRLETIEAPGLGTTGQAPSPSGAGTAVGGMAIGQPISLTGLGFDFRGGTASCRSSNVDQGLKPTLDRFSKCKNLFYVTCAYSPGTGHKAKSNHYIGMAIDIVPTKGGMSFTGPEWDELRNCLNSTSAAYLEEGRGTQNHHFHISHTGG